MVQYIQAHAKMESLVETVHANGQMEVRTRAIGVQERCMGKVSIIDLDSLPHFIPKMGDKNDIAGAIQF
jgi:hypothetical protein